VAKHLKTPAGEDRKIFAPLTACLPKSTYDIYFHSPGVGVVISEVLQKRSL